jgi:hypothetical protein
MNMMTLPPHLLILAGFLVGLIGSLAAVATAEGLSGRETAARSVETSDGPDQRDRALDRAR